MATNNYYSPSSFSSPLTIEQPYVLHLLKRCGFPQRRWKELGLTLGLHKNTLDAIERNHPGDVSRCLTECLSKWSSRADNVDSKGGATFDSLSDALKSLNENAAADKLDQEKCGTNDVHSIATGPTPFTGTNKPLIGGPPLFPIALIDILDDRPKVSELIKLHELLIKGQLEKFLPLLDPDTIRKIRNAVNDHERMSLLIRAFEEHPILLQKVRTTGIIKGLIKPIEGSMSPEYITMKEILADLVDLLAGNAPVISRLNNHLFSLAVIPQDVLNAVANPYPTPNERATRLINSLLTIIQTHSNPNSVFSFLITSLQTVGLNDMASKLMKTLKMKGGHVDPNLEQQPSVSKGPLQPVDVTAQSHTPQPTITGSQSSTLTTVIELSSKSEVAANIESLHSRFASLDSNIRDEFEELVERGKVKLKAVARSAAAYLSIQVSSLSYGNVDELFDSLQPHYDFFSFGVLKHLTDTYLSYAQTELTQYIDSVDKFSESSPIEAHTINNQREIVIITSSSLTNH
uniref:Death domain-containing protein n=1 Tax=Amphimedon queenslandica TaxID=400682 RepID=A0A1X7TKW7_AMPQE